MDAIGDFFQLLFNQFGINVVDLIILFVFFFYIIEGFSIGLIAGIFDFSSFVLSFVIGIKFYSSLGVLISKTFSIPEGFSYAIGFFVVAFVSEIVLNILLRKIYQLVYQQFTQERQMGLESEVFVWINRFLGIIPGMASAFVLLAFLLSVVISLPISPFLKHAVSTSRFGAALVTKTQVFDKSVNAVFGGAIHDTLNFLTVEPKSDESIDLKFKTTSITVDQQAEERMLVLVNKERSKQGVSPLIMDEPLRQVARAHSKDMFVRGYFSHYTPDGLSPFDRMGQANIQFQHAGENLALAPNVDLAMQGLMNSPGHRANILSSDFSRVGLGVIDGGIYGEMFSQEFTD